MLIQTTIEGVGVKSIEVKEIPSTPQFKVHFQRRPDYKGEYGFDWFRDYYETKLADKNKLQDLKNEYTPCKINNQDYFVPWLTLMPNATAELVLKVELNEGVKIKRNASGKIILPNHSGLKFIPAEIEISALRDEQEFKVTVECLSPLAADAKLEVTIDTDNQVVGKLNVLKNKVVPKVNLRFVKVVVYPGQKYDSFPGEAAYLDSVLTKNDIPNFIKTRAFNQALIDVNIDAGDYVIELDGTTLANEGKISGYEISNQIDSEFASGFRSLLFSEYLKKYENNNPSNSLIVFNTALQRLTTIGTVAGDSDLTNRKSRSCLIYNVGLDKSADHVHELGHVLGCLHSFEDVVTNRVIENFLNDGERIKGECRSKIKVLDNRKIDIEKLIVDAEGEIEKNRNRLATYQRNLTDPRLRKDQEAKVLENIYNCKTNISKFSDFISEYKGKLSDAERTIEELNLRIEDCDSADYGCQELLGQNPYAFDNKSGTSNFMDYSSNRVCFNKWQWLTMQKGIKDNYSN